MGTDDVPRGIEALMTGGPPGYQLCLRTLEPPRSSSVRAPAPAAGLQSADTSELLRSVRSVCLRNGNPRDLHKPGQVRPGFQQRRGDEIRPGIPQYLRALVRQSRRSPSPDQDSDFGQRGAQSLDEIARLLTAGWAADRRDTRPRTLAFARAPAVPKPAGASRLSRVDWQIVEQMQDARRRAIARSAPRRFRLTPCVCRTIRRRRAAARRGR